MTQPGPVDPGNYGQAGPPPGPQPPPPPGAPPGYQSPSVPWYAPFDQPDQPERPRGGPGGGTFNPNMKIDTSMARSYAQGGALPAGVTPPEPPRPTPGLGDAPGDLIRPLPKIPPPPPPPAPPPPPDDGDLRHIWDHMTPAAPPPPPGPNHPSGNVTGPAPSPQQIAAARINAQLRAHLEGRQDNLARLQDEVEDWAAANGRTVRWVQTGAQTHDEMAAWADRNGHVMRWIGSY